MKKGTLRLYKDDQKKLRWTLYGANGKKIADSAEGYNRRAGLNNALKYQSEYHKVIDDSGKQRKTFPSLGVYLNNH